MSDIEIGILGFVALFVLLALRMPVATTMMLVGFVGHLVLNERGALPTLAGETFHIPHVLSLTIGFVSWRTLTLAQGILPPIPFWIGIKCGFWPFFVSKCPCQVNPMPTSYRLLDCRRICRINISIRAY